MNLKIQPLFLLAISLMIASSFLFSCNNDDDEQPSGQESDSFILEESAFGCSNYQSVDLQLSDNINAVYQFGDYFFLATFDDRLIIKEELDGAIFAEENIEVNKFIPYNTKLMICSEEGIFEVDEQLNFEQKSDLRCLDIEVSPNEKLLVSISGNNTYTSDKIYELDLDQNEITPHTNSSGFNGISNFTFTSENEIWAIAYGISDNLVRFQDGIFVEQFNAENSPIFEQLVANETFLLPYKGDLIFVAKPGAPRYKILKYSSEEWITLKEFDGNNEDISEKDIYMTLPAISDAIIYKDRLYVATTLAGCRGIHRFDITKEEALQNEDYDVIQDPSLPSQCLDHFFVSADGKLYISDQHSVTSMDCL